MGSHRRHSHDLSRQRHGYQALSIAVEAAGRSWWGDKDEDTSGDQRGAPLARRLDKKWLTGQESRWQQSFILKKCINNWSEYII